MMLARRLQLNASAVVGHVGSRQRKKEATNVTNYAGNTNMQQTKQSTGMGLGVSV